jgi:hypothetical protein
MHPITCDEPRPERGTIVPRPKRNGFTQPPDEAWQVLRGHVLRVFLFLVSTTRSWRRYCDATIPEITAALNEGRPKGERISERTVARALETLRTKKVPGRDHCFISEERVGLKYLRYPVDKGGNCMLPSKEPDKIVPQLRTEMSGTEACATKEAPAHSGQTEIENVNVAAASREQLADQGVLERVPDAVVDSECAELEAMPTEDLRAIAADRRHCNMARSIKARGIIGNRLTRDQTVNPRIPAVPTVQPAAAPAAATAAPVPVTLEGFLRHLKPGCDPKIRDAAARHMAAKLDDNGNLPFHRRVVDAIASGAYDGRRVNRYFVKAMSSSIGNRAGWFVNLIKPHPWAAAAPSAPARRR